jgi:hypothetical protein
MTTIATATACEVQAPQYWLWAKHAGLGVCEAGGGGVLACAPRPAELLAAARRAVHAAPLIRPSAACQAALGMRGPGRRVWAWVLARLGGAGLEQ